MGGHNMKTRFSFVSLAAILLCALAVPAVAETSDCAGLTEIKAKLACKMQERRTYRGELERTLSQSDSVPGVFVEEVGDMESGAYPKLIVWSFLTKDTVLKLVSEAEILDNARKAGFRMVQFTDKTDQDTHWFFDLTKPGMTLVDVKVRSRTARTGNIGRPE
jgi:hypothetical protein